MVYRLQGSDYNDVDSRCNISYWIPLNGPGFEGGNTTYSAPCITGYTCLQGSSEHYRDAPIYVTYSNNSIPNGTILTWSGSASKPSTSYYSYSNDCSRDPVIPTDKTALYFEQLLIK